MKIKITKLDRLFSNFIRTRDKWTCRKCKTIYTPPTNGLHCAHIQGRRHRGTRWHELNAVALCAGCHIHFTGDPLEFYDWLKTEIGEKNLDWLRFTAKKVTKFTRADLLLLERELKKKLEALT